MKILSDPEYELYTVSHWWKLYVCKPVSYLFKSFTQDSSTAHNNNWHPVNSVLDTLRWLTNTNYSPAQIRVKIVVAQELNTLKIDCLLTSLLRKYFKSMPEVCTGLCPFLLGHENH